MHLRVARRRKHGHHLHVMVIAAGLIVCDVLRFWILADGARLGLQVGASLPRLLWACRLGLIPATYVSTLLTRLEGDTHAVTLQG